MFGDNTAEENLLESYRKQIEYYEALIDYLDDRVPCLDELITMFNEGEDE